MSESAIRPLRLRSARPPFVSAAASGPPLSVDPSGVLRRVRAVRRGVAVIVWTLLCMPVQALFLLLPGRPKVVFARLYWSVVAWLLGVEIRLIGSPASGHRPVVFVSNHSSWLDVPVLGGRLEACFVSKDDVARWPVVSTVARLGRTVFVSRQRGATGRERDMLRSRLAAGDSLMLFPEGTTSDGSRVLPFRSSFFAIGEGAEPPLIQPVSIVYDRLGGLPTGRAARPIFAWYGDMDLAPHFWQLAQHKGLRVSVLLHPPLDPARYASRKALAHAVWHSVADGAAALRQNRAVSAPSSAGEAAGDPAYA